MRAIFDFFNIDLIVFCHHHHQFGFYSIISHRKISRMVLVIFMIQLCTIATLMFVQNNTSQKLLIIASRTIQFPGVVFKVCIYIIVCHRHLKLYISMSKVPILIENIYISNLQATGLEIYFPHISHFCVCKAFLLCE